MKISFNILILCVLFGILSFSGCQKSDGVRKQKQLDQQIFKGSADTAATSTNTATNTTTTTNTGVVISDDDDNSNECQKAALTENSVYPVQGAAQVDIIPVCQAKYRYRGQWDTGYTTYLKTADGKYVGVGVKIYKADVKEELTGFAVNVAVGQLSVGFGNYFPYQVPTSKLTWQNLTVDTYKENTNTTCVEENNKSQNPVIISSPDVAKKISEGIVNNKKFWLPTKGLEDGIYHFLLCDIDKMANCNLADKFQKSHGFHWGYQAVDVGSFRSVMMMENDQAFPLGNPADSNESGYLGGIFSVKVKDGVPTAAVIMKEDEAQYGAPKTTFLMEVLYKYGGILNNYWGDGSEGQNAQERQNAITAAGGECTPLTTPLVVDLDNTGVSLSAPLSGVLFDIDADGKKDQISWVTNDSIAFLVLDKNNNSMVDSGDELFGNRTLGPDSKVAENGFQALAKYDDNHDGVMDSKDKIFDTLRLWIDKNHNGLTEPGELFTLKEKKIVSFDLGYIQMDEADEYGNRTKQRSVVNFESGDLRTVFDIWFRQI